jgi:hypothetical protein
MAINLPQSCWEKSPSNFFYSTPAPIIFQAPSKPLIINSGTKGRLTVVLLYAVLEKWSQQTQRKRNAQIIEKNHAVAVWNYGNKTLARGVHVYRNKKFSL